MCGNILSRKKSTPALWVLSQDHTFCSQVPRDRFYRERNNDILLCYRAAVHSTTMSPYELFGRPMTTALPKGMQPLQADTDSLVCTNDAAAKRKSKDYTKKRQSQSHSIKFKDVMLCNQKKVKTLEPTFNPQPYVVITLYGSQVKSLQGRIRRAKREARVFSTPPHHLSTGTT